MTIRLLQDDSESNQRELREQLHCVIPSELKILPIFCCHFQILPGCGCCEVNGELVADKHTWHDDGKEYGE